MRRYRYTTDLDTVRAHALRHGADVVEWGEGVDVLVSTDDREAWLAYDSTLPVAPDTVGPDEAIGEPVVTLRASQWADVKAAVERGDTAAASAALGTVSVDGAVKGR